MAGKSGSVVGKTLAVLLLAAAGQVEAQMTNGIYDLFLLRNTTITRGTIGVSVDDDNVYAYTVLAQVVCPLTNFVSGYGRWASATNLVGAGLGLAENQFLEATPDRVNVVTYGRNPDNPSTNLTDIVAMTTIDLQVYAPIQDVSSARTIDGPNGSKTHAFSFIDGQGNIRLYDLDHGAVSNPVVDATNIAGHAKGLDMYFVDGTGVENLNYMVVADQGVGTNGVKANEKLFNHFGKQQSTEITCNRTIRNTEDVAMANNKLYGVRDYTTLGFGQLNEYDFTAGLARITSLQQPDQPRLTARLVDAKFAFSFPTKTNATYVVERLDDSLSSIWIPVTTIIGNGTPATYSCTFCNESPGMAWFRVKKQ